MKDVHIVGTQYAQQSSMQGNKPIGSHRNTETTTDAQSESDTSAGARFKTPFAPHGATDAMHGQQNQQRNGGVAQNVNLAGQQLEQVIPQQAVSWFLRRRE